MEWEKVLPLVLLHLMAQSIEKGDFPKKHEIFAVHNYQCMHIWSNVYSM